MGVVVLSESYTGGGFAVIHATEEGGLGRIPGCRERTAPVLPVLRS